MNIYNMLAELRSQHQQIGEAIVALERLATAGGGKRRGRPPKWMASARTSATIAIVPGRRRKPFSAASRRKMAAAQRKRWAAVRKAINAA